MSLLDVRCVRALGREVADACTSAQSHLSSVSEAVVRNGHRVPQMQFDLSSFDPLSWALTTNLRSVAEPDFFLNLFSLAC